MKIFFLLVSLLIVPIVFGQVVFPTTTQSTSGLSAGGDEPLVCPLHKEKMVNGSVPIRYGLIRMYLFEENEAPERGKLVAEYLRSKKEQFPETHRWVNGGCDPGFHGYAKSMTMHYCQMCRRLEDEWFSKHPQFLKEDKLP